MTEQGTKDKNNKLTLRITTPRGVKFVEQADMIIFRAIDGERGFLPGHAPLATALGDGTLRIINDGVEQKLAVFGGLIEINNRTVNLYSTIAQRPEEIDLERARQDREEAEAALAEKKDDAQLGRLQMLLRRSLVRIEVNLHMEDEDFFEEDIKNK